MFKYLLRRVLSTIPVFFGITLITFGILHLTPGEPAGMQAQMNARSSDITQQLRAEYGLDRPLVVQYVDWLSRIVRLDFGYSMSMDRRPVLDKIKDALPVTLLFNGIELILVFLFSVPLGIWSAVRRGKAVDHTVTVASFLFYSSPGFWLALLLMLLFSVELGWLPISGLGEGWYNTEMPWYSRVGDVAAHMVLPILTILFGSVAAMTRYVRMTMVEVLEAEYIRTARAKGVGPLTVLLKHGLRNGLLPIITLIGLSLPGLIGGSVILESIFALPGMGRLFYQAVMMRDYTLLMAILSLASFLTLAGNLLADILYAVVDPRIRDRIRSTG